LSFVDSRPIAEVFGRDVHDNQTFVPAYLCGSTKSAELSGPVGCAGVLFAQPSNCSPFLALELQRQRSIRLMNLQYN
jgi:hypothetical protein